MSTSLQRVHYRSLSAVHGPCSVHASNLAIDWLSKRSSLVERMLFCSLLLCCRTRTFSTSSAQQAISACNASSKFGHPASSFWHSLCAWSQVHNERELQRVSQLDGLNHHHLIGINNRSLETFEVDLNTTPRLLSTPTGQDVRHFSTDPLTLLSFQLLYRGVLIVGESGIFTKNDLRILHRVRFGDALMK